MNKTTGDNFISFLYHYIYLLFAKVIVAKYIHSKTAISIFIMSFHYSIMYKNHLSKESQWLFFVHNHKY